MVDNRQLSERICILAIRHRCGFAVCRTLACDQFNSLKSGSNSRAYVINKQDSERGNLVTTDETFVVQRLPTCIATNPVPKAATGLCPEKVTVQRTMSRSAIANGAIAFAVERYRSFQKWA